MTEPSASTALPSHSAPPGPPPPAHRPLPPSPVTFPLGWMLENAGAPIRYRASREVCQLPQEAHAPLEELVYGYKPAIAIALLQSAEGSWGERMLTVPSPRSATPEGVGTIPAVRRLLEYGWDHQAPPILHARRLLFRLLAEDDDPAVLYELGRGGGKLDPETVRHGRAVLRDAAAAALAQAGYEGDPRLRGAARRLMDRIADFIRSPLSERPFVRIGNKHVLAPEAVPPSVDTLIMLAHMPLFRSEHSALLDLIYEHISRPLPRQEPVVMVGKRIVGQPQLVLGDMLPTRNAADADVPWALMWLELMARLGFLRRNDGWSRLFDRMLDERDENGVWHPHKGLATPRSSNPLVWPYYPLEGSQAGEERWTDVTFRLGLIARAAGHPIEIV